MKTVDAFTTKSRTVVLAALLASLAGVASPAFADVYKQVRPDGSVIYTDTPVAGIKAQKMPQLSEGLQSRPESQMPRGPASRPQMGSSNGVQLPQLPPLPGLSISPPVAPPPPPPTFTPSSTSTDTSAVAQAQAALDKALQAKAAGSEPLEGERTGTAHGGSRLNQEYDKRQQELDAAVAAARDAVKQARGR